MSARSLSMDTLRPIGGLDHLRQSVRDILLTPIGSRVLRRDYGSRLFELVDDNLTPPTLALIYAATVDALAEWEPRLRITRVQAEPVADDLEHGKIAISLDADYVPDGRQITIDGVVV